MIDAGFSTLSYGGTSPADIEDGRVRRNARHRPLARQSCGPAARKNQRSRLSVRRSHGPRRVRRLYEDLKRDCRLSHPGKDRAPVHAIARRDGRLPVPAWRRALASPPMPICSPL
jgi:hypothetical protein